MQAADGIRYAQESRGLGDVYKRQFEVRAERGQAVLAADLDLAVLLSLIPDHYPVSYTHLTLPTI